MFLNRISYIKNIITNFSCNDNVLISNFSIMYVCLCVLALLIVYPTIKTVHSETWQENKINLHTHIQTYSRNINSSQAISTSLNECISVCFADKNSSFLYHKALRVCQCHQNKLDFDSGEATVETNQLYGFYLNGYRSYKLESFKKWHVFPEHRDCLSLYQSGFVEDGVYLIYPDIGIGVNTWCDMTNGGWTLIQRRLDGREDFYRTWDEYVSGFGNETGEFWLGLDYIHALTQSPSSLYIEMEAFGDLTPSSAYALYTSFTVDDVLTNFTMYVNGYSGDCGDSLEYHNGKQFSTLDRDNDESPSKHCAVRFSGAWWYKSCHLSNLNGLYLSGNHSSFANGINWSSCWGLNYSVKSTVMKIKRSA